jgi:DNA-binding SARP family transcriptional activator
MASGFSFSVLGPVRAWRDGAEVSLGSPQQRAVLAALLLRDGAFISAGELIDVLWPDNPPRSASGTVRTYVYRLRGILGAEKLPRSGSGYTLTLTGDDLDASRLRRLTERAGRARAAGDPGAAASHLGAALALWRGTPLTGISGPFAESQRGRLEEARLTARRRTGRPPA